MIGEEVVKIKKQPDLPIRFKSVGTFKILQVADMHYGNGILSRCKDVSAHDFHFCSDLNTTRFVNKLIQLEKPDFIAFTGVVFDFTWEKFPFKSFHAEFLHKGDNIFGPSTADAAESLVEAFSPAIESKLPWAAILGNHDQESTMTREELMSFISLMDYSVSQINPSSQESVRTDIEGFGNYDIKVYGALGSHFANTSLLDLFFLDSGDRAIVNGIRTYGWIKESQLRWLRSISKGFQAHKQDLHSDALLGITRAPALTFFHIPIPEVKQLWYTKFSGQFQEGVACSSVNSGVLQTLTSIKDIKAVFIGHDHLNDFCGEINGIWLCYGGGSGYHGYGKVGWERRARVILTELEKGKKEWLGVEKIKTWKRLDDGSLSKIDEQVLWDRRSSS
ncbi:hypothetical protein IFM89_004648 [Coptis chinensis]|uniref:Calcineurin-like phosphoesterase domain-containing protein n=1 Tax=Coptis chinensis TaxID=261450 RepID=A0A835I7E4_9MAGN|nr:hypothetical protein IFM89_004648 [Coptis chinensis]